MMIGERLVDLRKDKGMTQSRLAEKLLINYRTYSGYERNEIEANDSFKLRLAKFHNVSIDYLLGLTDRPRPVQPGTEYVRLPRPLSEAGLRELEGFIAYLTWKERGGSRD